MKTLTVIREDHPGLLAEVSTLLAKEGIEVIDFNAQALGNTALISLTIAPYQETFRLLSDAGYKVVANEHLLVRLDKHAGALAELSRRLAEAKVVVRSMHIVNRDENAGIVAVETTNLEAAREVLKDLLVWED